jgi:hypothetical protein
VRIAVFLCLLFPGALRAQAQRDTSARALLAIEATVDGVRLTNRSKSRVYFKLFERSLSERIDWVSCTQAPKCDGIDPSKSRVVPWKSIVGFEPRSTEVHVYSWRLTRIDQRRYHAVDMTTNTVRRPSRR